MNKTTETKLHPDTANILEFKEFFNLLNKGLNQEGKFKKTENIKGEWVAVSDLARLKKTRIYHLTRYLKKANFPMKKAVNPRTKRLATYVFISEEIKSQVETLYHIQTEITLNDRAVFQALERKLISMDDFAVLIKMFDKPVTVTVNLPLELVASILKKMVKGETNNFTEN